MCGKGSQQEVPGHFGPHFPVIRVAIWTLSGKISLSKILKTQRESHIPHLCHKINCVTHSNYFYYQCTWSDYVPEVSHVLKVDFDRPQNQSNSPDPNHHFLA